MKLSWLHQQDSWVITLALMMAMLAFAEVGYRVGQRRHSRTGDTGRGHFNMVQASMLGLLALLLGFTFNMSNVRYETRRQLVQEDANVLAAMELRSRFLPNPCGTQFRQLLRQYVTLLADVAALRLGPTDDELARRTAQGQVLHRGMCELVRAEIQSGHVTKPLEDLVSLLSDAVTIHEKRINAYEGRVPDIILILLFGAAAIASTAVGYSGGLGKHRGVLAAAMLTLLVGGTVYTILDLDQPRRGLIRIEQTPMLRVQQYLNQDMQTADHEDGPRKGAF
jgi:hypothetical protein